MAYALASRPPKEALEKPKEVFGLGALWNQTTRRDSHSALWSLRSSGNSLCVRGMIDRLLHVFELYLLVLFVPLPST